jgi:hypothetical protein
LAAVLLLEAFHTVTVALDVDYPAVVQQPVEHGGGDDRVSNTMILLKKLKNFSRYMVNMDRALAYAGAVNLNL